MQVVRCAHEQTPTTPNTYLAARFAPNPKRQHKLSASRLSVTRKQRHVHRNPPFGVAAPEETAAPAPPGCRTLFKLLRLGAYDDGGPPETAPPPKPLPPAPKPFPKPPAAPEPGPPQRVEVRGRKAGHARCSARASSGDNSSSVW